MKILVLNGPNLNLLGEREPSLYGSVSLQDINQRLLVIASDLKSELRFFQSNHEGELIDFLHENRHWADAVLINPAAYTHTSVALRDALLAIAKPFVEVHLSKPHERESFRHHSFFSDIALKTFSGEKEGSYFKALKYLIEQNR